MTRHAAKANLTAEILQVGRIFQIRRALFVQHDGTRMALQRVTAECYKKLESLPRANEATERI